METLTYKEYGQEVWLDRYCLRDRDGNKLENSIEDSFKRLASFLSSKEPTNKWKKEFLEALSSYRFIPAGRIWANAGTENSLLYNCWFMSVEDSRKSIFSCLWEAMELMARGGGVGFNFSRLRPEGAPVKGVRGTASGPVSFIDVYDTAIGTIKQGGSRRGAALALLDVSHPDILKFIEAKRIEGRWSNFNVSINISNKFIEAVKNGDEWPLTFDGKEYETLKAADIWDDIVEGMWTTGEPGLLNMEVANYWSNSAPLGYVLEGTNPCGEQPLENHGSCNLGSINLVSHVKDGEFDFELLEETVALSVRMLDNVIDLNEYPFESYSEIGLDLRRIGLGLMGLADTLFLLKMRYGSKDSMKFIERLLTTLRDKAYITSTELAEEKGNFPVFDADKVLKSKYIKTLPKSIREAIKNKGLRNVALLSQPPTGSTSMLAGVSAGHEPAFSLDFVRRDRIREVRLIDPIYSEWLKDNEGKPVPDYFVTAHDLSLQDHINIHLLFTKYIDSASSKTINLLHKTTTKDISNAILPIVSELKGITVYREGSRSLEVLSRGTATKILTSSQQLDVPDIADGIRMRRLTAECGKITLTVTENDDDCPIEIWLEISKSRGGHCVTSFKEALARLCSKALQFGVPLEEIADSLKEIRCDKPKIYGGKCLSCADGISRMIEELLGIKLERKIAGAITCSNCGSAEIASYTEDENECVRCLRCGYKSCSPV